MTGTEVFLLAVLGLTWIFTILVQRFSYREGWEHGYGAGYDDCEDEGFHGEPPGTRDKRNGAALTEGTEAASCGERITGIYDSEETVCVRLVGHDGGHHSIFTGTEGAEG